MTRNHEKISTKKNSIYAIASALDGYTIALSIKMSFTDAVKVRTAGLH
jgi:hypothetical protein